MEGKMGVNERTIVALEAIKEAIKVLKKHEKLLNYHIGQQKLQMNKYQK
jgi:hypothetical protein